MRALAVRLLFAVVLPFSLAACGGGDGGGGGGGSDENRAPVADAGNDGAVDEGAAVSLDGGDSSDPDGDALTFSWTQTGGTPQVEFVVDDAARAELTAPAVAEDTELTFQLSVSDGERSDTDTVVVTVRNVNRAPVANAGGDSDIVAGGNVMLSAAASSDPDGDGLSFQWTQTDGEPNVVLANADTAEAGFVAPNVLVETTLTFTVTVNDGALEDSDSVVITVVPATADNLPPVADAGVDQDVDEGAAVMLDGTASTDPEGDPLTFAWTQIGGDAIAILNGADTAQPTFTAPDVLVDTALTFQLSVSDGEHVATDQVVVNVRFVNQAPEANAGPDFVRLDSQGALLIADLNGTGSSDPDGDVLTYAWTQTAGPGIAINSATFPTANFRVPNVVADQALTFELTVTDSHGASDSDTVDVTIQFVNQPPFANAGPDQSRQEFTIFALDGSNSSDPDGGLTYEWELPVGFTTADVSTPVLGITGTPDIVVNTTYEFTLTVRDAEGAEDSDTLTLTLTYLNEPPVASAGGAQAMAEGGTLILDGSGSADPNGEVTFQWTVPAGFTTGPTNEAQLNITGTPDVLADENHDFVLTVTDIDGVTDVDTATVTVQFVNQLPLAAVVGPQFLRELTPFQLDAGASSDADGDGLDFTWTVPAGFTTGATDQETLDVTGTPDIAALTDFTFSVLVEDGRGGADTQEHVISLEPEDGQPDDFAFVAIDPAPWDTLIESNVVAVSGINVPVPLAVTGDPTAEVSINGGPFLADDGSLQLVDGDSFRLRVRTAAAGATVATATATVGRPGETVAATLNVTTEAQDMTPDPFTVAAKGNAEPGAATDSDPVLITGMEAGVPVNVNATAGMLVSVGGGAFVATPTTIQNGQTLTLRLTASADFNGEETGLVTIGDFQSAFFTVTTRGPVTVATLTAFTDVVNAPQGSTGHTSTTMVGALEVAVPVRIGGDASARFQVNGGPVFDSTELGQTVDAGDVVTVTLDASATGFLAETTATLTVGGAGDEVSETFTVTNAPDVIAPVVAVNFPFNGAIANSAQINFRGTAADNDTVAEVRIVEAVGGAVIAATVPVDGEWLAQVDLGPAHNDLVVEAEDAAGNVTQLPYELYRDGEQIVSSSNNFHENHIDRLPDGDLVLADIAGNRLLRIDLDTGLRTLLSGEARGVGESLGAFGGNIVGNVVVDGATDQIYAVSSSRDVVRIDPVTGDRTLVSDNQDIAQGPAIAGVDRDIALDINAARGANRLIFAIADEVWAIDLSVGALGTRTLLTDNVMHPAPADPLDLVQAIAVDTATGEIFIADNLLGTGFRILRLAPDGSTRTTLAAPAVGTGPNPSGDIHDIQVVNASTLAVAWHDRILHVNRSTGNRTLVSGPGVGTGPTLEDVETLLVEPDGNYLVSSSKMGSDATHAPIVSDAIIVRIDPATGNRTSVHRRARRAAGTFNPAGAGLESLVVSGDIFLTHSQFGPGTLQGFMLRIDPQTADFQTFVTATSELEGVKEMVLHPAGDRVVMYQHDLNAAQRFVVQSLVDSGDRQVVETGLSAFGNQGLSSITVSPDGDFVFARREQFASDIQRFALRDGYRSDGSGAAGDLFVATTFADGQGTWSPNAIGVDAEHDELVILDANNGSRWWTVSLPDIDGTTASARTPHLATGPIVPGIENTNVGLMDVAGASMYILDKTYSEGGAWVGQLDIVGGGTGVVADNVVGNGSILDRTEAAFFEPATATIWLFDPGHRSILQMDPATGDRVAVIVQ